MQNNFIQVMARWPRWLLVVGLICWPVERTRALVAPCYYYTNGCYLLPQDANDQDDEDNNCDPPSANDGPTGGDSPCGMPVWRVSEPFINL